MVVPRERERRYRRVHADLGDGVIEHRLFRVRRAVTLRGTSGANRSDRMSSMPWHSPGVFDSRSDLEVGAEGVEHGDLSSAPPRSWGRLAALPHLPQHRDCGSNSSGYILRPPSPIKGVEASMRRVRS